MESIVEKNARRYWMGLAMVWIIIFHWLQPVIDNESLSSTIRTWLSRVSGSGYLGVDIFLFLSAYGLCYSFESNNFKNYLLRRLKRIFPIFLIFIVPFLYFVGEYTAPIELSKATLLHVTGLSTLTGTSYAWYMPATILIYWSFPIIFYLVRKLMSINPASIFLLLIAMLFAQQLADPYIFWLMNGRFKMVVLGIATYIALNRMNQWRNERNLTMFFLVPVIIAAIFAKTKVEIVGMSIPMIFYLIDKCAITKYFERSLNFIGKYTLEIYLAQCLCIEYFTPSRVIAMFSLNNYNEPMILWAFVMLLEIATTIIVAFLLHFIQKSFFSIFNYKILGPSCDQS